MGIITFLKDNFMHVAPILACGFLAIALIAERYRALYKEFPIRDLDGFLEKVSGLVMSSKITDATAYCDQFKDKPVAKVVKSALNRAHLPESVIQDGVQIALQKSIQSVLKRTSFLATIANVATLLGLFGTIAGLIQSFEAVGHADAQQKSALLSAGIATAMNATMLGLAVAIPCMIAFSVLSNRSNALISELEESSVQILDVLKQRFYSSEYVDSVVSGTQEGEARKPARKSA